MQPATSAYQQDPLVEARLNKHQHAAVACLLTHEFHKLDPATGDASCQVRAIIVLIFHQNLKKWLDDIWDNAVKLSQDYNYTHLGDKPDTKTKTITEIQGADHSKDFDDLVNVVRDFLGEEDFELLGLTYSLCAAGIAGLDEFDIDFRHRSNNLWGSHEKSLKARLAKLSCATFIKFAEEVHSNGKLIDVLQETRSVIKNEGADDVPVLSIQATFLTALAILYARGIPIVNSIIRIQINGDGQSQHHTYTFGNARSFIYLANHQTGKFELLKNPSPEQKCCPAFYIKSWSTYHANSTSKSLYSPDHKLYYHDFAKISLLWAVIVYSAAHPPFSRRAERVDLDLTSAYEGIDGTIQSDLALQHDRFDLEGLNYENLVSRSSDRPGPNLATKHKFALEVANQHQLNEECQFVRMGAPSTECTWRITKPIDWQIAHASAATVSWVDNRLEGLAERHRKASNAIIGRFVFSLGKLGASHVDRSRATELHNTKKETVRRKNYLADYPQNESLLNR
ncbi:uncharacterized protein LY89DRAFT_674966 [Mollisia scopiformis]|uniref:Uncharacterized protein n=1 Tax=Mollisia scopiformis TaxID=149040 RepID=A0A194WSB1_MOLSC|nr:uncharacterized protein LY89DRAFT_674966 [Mollisia scopiformis]KUJ10855.1 hypothetical protein LY89DRAFT_674966 [Mollisia scopiformis]